MQSTDSMQSLSNYQWLFFTELEQKISQFIWKPKRPQIAKAVLRRKNGAGGIKLPEFRLCYKATIMHDTGQKQTYRPMEQDRNPRNKPCTYGYLIFDKGGENIQWGKDNLFNKWCWENCTATCKKMKLEHFLTQYTNSK